MLKKIIETGEIAGSKIITKWLLGIAVFLIVVIVLGGAGVLYRYYYSGKIYPGVRLAELNVGGKTKEQARILFQAKLDQLTEAGMVFKYNDQRETIKPILYGSDGEGVSYELWNYDLEKMIDEVYAVGRKGSDWLETIQGMLGRTKIVPEYKIKEQEVVDILKGKFGQLEKPGEEAKLVLIENGPVATKEQPGQVFDYEQALAQLKKERDFVDDPA